MHTRIEALVTPRTRAIVPVHYAGIACDMDAILDIARRHNLLVIEDAAQGIDSFYKGRPLGSIGDLAAFSFHETKNVQCGEGGLLAINNPEFVRRAEILWEKGTNRAEFFRGEVNKYGWVDTGSSFLPAEYVCAFLSTDYRHQDGTHDFVYGLPELNRKAIVRGAKHIANTGRFATAIQLALLPLAKNLLLNKDVHVFAITGSTGAGVKPAPTSHFSWRNDNISIYKPFRHQHLDEIRQSLSQLQNSFASEIDFIPVRGCFSRGIFATLYLDCPVELSEIRRLYDDYYSDHNFTFVTDKMPDLKDVVNTNKCLLHLEKEGNKLIIVSVIDNLLKGASGTAVHNMNLLFGLHERTGLCLKGSAF